MKIVIQTELHQRQQFSGCMLISNAITWIQMMRQGGGDQMNQFTRKCEILISEFKVKFAEIVHMVHIN